MKLAFALLLLAGVLVWGATSVESLQLFEPSAISAGRAQARTPAAQTSAPPSGDADASSEFVAAPPLFRPAQAPTPVGPVSGEHFALVGLATRSDTKVAYLRDTADGRNWTVRAGDHVGAWIVSEINDRCVVLNRARRRQAPCV